MVTHMRMPTDDVTLGSLLAEPALRLTQVAGPHLPTRVIRWAHSTDLLCPQRYLRGGELVLTVGSALTTPQRCAAFVGALASAGAHAVGFGIGDVHDEVPVALREACDHHDLPLLLVPFGVAFQTFTELLAEHRVQRGLRGARRTGTLVSAALDAMARPGGPVDVLVLIATELGGLLLIVDDRGLVEASAGHRPASAAAVTHVVELFGSPPARLGWQPGQELPAGTALEILGQLAHPVTLWRHERSESKLRAARDLGRLLGLVLDGLAEPQALTEPLGGDPSVELAACAWPISQAGHLRVLAPEAPRAVVEEVLITFLDEPTLAQTFAEAHGLACGTGRPRPVDGLAQSVSEALAALALSRRRGRPVAATELATLDAMLECLPQDTLTPFVDQLLGPLFEHDRRSGSTLVASLRAFLDGDGVVPTARALFLHPNTLRHRLGRVAEISGRDPLRWSDRVCFTFALAALDQLSARTGRARGDAPM